MERRAWMRRAAIAVSVALVIGACQRPASGGDTAGDTMGAAGMPSNAAGSSSIEPTLVGVTWELIELGGQPAPMGAGDRRATLIVEGGGESRANGFAGCNRWFSSYTLTRPDQIQFTAPGATKMACATGMDLEQRYLAMLPQVRRYTMSDSTAVLHGETGPLAKFVAR